MALALPEQTHAGLMEIEVRAGLPAAFSRAIQGVALRERWQGYHYACLDGGATYVRWSGLGEFLVSSDGKRILCARAPECSMEAFQVYLLGQALSFALVKCGLEPLHSTAIAADGEAVAFLGSSGFGKSTLAACFLAAGHSLITDDLLILQPGAGGMEAFPGPPRIKLFPEAARRFLGSVSGVPMNSLTDKLVLPLESQARLSALPLRAIYAIAPPHNTGDAPDIRIEALSPREAFVALAGNTFNSLLADPDRLRRQVGETTRLLSAVPVKRLSYPRGLEHLPSVREAVLHDLGSGDLRRIPDAP
jgi:hypothetical protein